MPNELPETIYQPAQVLNVTAELEKKFIEGVNSAQQFDSMTIFAIFCVGVICIMVIMLWVYFWLESKKSKILKFNTETEFEIKSIDIKDNQYKTKNKTWIFDKTKPLLMKTMFGFRPAYIIKDNVCIPFQFSTKDKECRLSPESLKNFTDHDNIKQIMKLTSDSTKQLILFLIIGVVVGAVLGVLLGKVLGV